jgi:myo-inositol catabolism protein IolC
VNPGGRVYVLAIDHRASFRRWTTDVLGRASSDSALRDLKVLVADALVATATATASATATATAAAPAVTAGPDPRGRLGILVDTEYGGPALARARSTGVLVVVPAERSGMSEFAFEHGDEFGDHIRTSGADVVKALVRYNPATNPEGNARSRARLEQLGEWCEASGTPLMLELLVPPGSDDVDGAGRVRPDFEGCRRLALTCDAVDELRRTGLGPAWWKLEGQPDADGFATLAAATGASAGETTCVVLGRGVTGPQLLDWIDLAAATPGFSGFAVGRSLWAEPLQGVLRGELSGDRATQMIGESYRALIERYEQQDHHETGPAPDHPVAGEKGRP